VVVEDVDGARHGPDGVDALAVVEVVPRGIPGERGSEWGERERPREEDVERERESREEEGDGWERKWWVSDRESETATERACVAQKMTGKRM